MTRLSIAARSDQFTKCYLSTATTPSWSNSQVSGIQTTGTWKPTSTISVWMLSELFKQDLVEQVLAPITPLAHTPRYFDFPLSVFVYMSISNHRFNPASLTLY